MKEREGEAKVSVKSADRALDVIELVASAPHQFGFSELMARLDIPKSSLSQLLANLTGRGYLTVDGPRGRYGIGAAMRALAAAVEGSIPVRRFIHDAIETLRDRLNENVSFYEVRGDEIELVDHVPTRHALHYAMVIGGRVPLYAHSAGKVALSRMSADELAGYLDRTELRPLAPQTIVSKAVLKRQAAEARVNGIAFAREELEAGICGLAVPVMFDGALLGMINVALPVVRHTDHADAEIRRLLPAAVIEIHQAIQRQRSAAQPREG